ncbi:MAG: hypothetical protein AB1428_14735 [Bacteroidota bacterium]
MRITLICALVLSASAVELKAQHANPDAPIAKAGDTYITEGEFLRRFELLPGFGRHRKGRLEEAKAEILYSLIAEKLLAQEAEARGLGRDSSITAAVDEIRKMLVRDELYRREVIRSVRVTDKEVIQGVVRAPRTLLLRYLYLPDSSDAHFVRSRLGIADDLSRMDIDPSLHAERDTVTIEWGEADPAIEDAAYRLVRGALSPPVRAGSGWYILALVSEQVSERYGSVQPSALTEQVAKTLRLRAERARLDAFMVEVLKYRTGFAVRRTLMAVAKAWAAAAGGGERDSQCVLNPETIAIVRTRCRDILHDSLAVVDATVWTVGDILDRLALKNLAAQGRNPQATAAALDGQLRVWVQQELIARVGLQRGLDTIPDIRERLDMWKQYFLSDQLKQRLTVGVKATDAEVWGLLRQTGTTADIPQVNIREFRAASLGDLQDALEIIEGGISFEEVIRERSADPEARTRGGVSGWFSIVDRPPVGEIAWSMEPHERFGPVRIPQGYLYFELLAKRSVSPSDSITAARFAAAQAEVLRLKRQRRISQFVAQSAQDRGFAVYEERLKAISVSPLPMMTYRVLGFGGRMFEVPFVQKQIEWLDIETPGERILP